MKHEHTCPASRFQSKEGTFVKQREKGREGFFFFERSILDEQVGVGFVAEN